MRKPKPKTKPKPKPKVNTAWETDMQLADLKRVEKQLNTAWVTLTDLHESVPDDDHRDYLRGAVSSPMAWAKLNLFFHMAKLKRLQQPK